MLKKYAVTVGVLIAVGYIMSACRSLPAPVAETPPAVETAVPVPEANTNRVENAEVETASETGRVVSVYMDEAGETFWDGEAVSPEELRARLAALRSEDTVAWCGGAPEAGLNASQQNLFEYIVKLGLKTVWVPQSESENTATGSGGRPVTVNTKYVREALNLYDRLKGRDSEFTKRLPADVVMRFEPDAQRGYILRRVELGVVGQSLWVVHESLSDTESATSIQFKKEW